MTDSKSASKLKLVTIVDDQLIVKWTLPTKDQSVRIGVGPRTAVVTIRFPLEERPLEIKAYRTTMSVGALEIREETYLTEDEFEELRRRSKLFLVTASEIRDLAKALAR